MKFAAIFIVTFTILDYSFFAFANDIDGNWRELKTGKVVADTASQKSVKGFGGAVLATADTDWQQKWSTDPNTVPNFNKAGFVGIDIPVYILILFSNPKLDASKVAKVECDFEVDKPDGSSLINQKQIDCRAGVISGNPSNTFLCQAGMTFQATKNDPKGKWLVKVTLRDKLAGTEMKLKTDFRLK